MFSIRTYPVILHPNSLWLRSGTHPCPYDLDRKKNDIGGGTPFVFDLFLLGNGHLFYNVSSYVCCVGEQICINEGAISCPMSMFTHSICMLSPNGGGVRGLSSLYIWNNSSSKGHQARPLLLWHHSDVVTFSISC